MIKDHLRQEGITAAEFGRRSGIEKGTLSLLLNETTNPENMKAGTLRRVAKELGKPMEELLSGQQQAFSAAQLRNSIEALQIVARALASALGSNLRHAGRDISDAIDADANDPARAKPFATDSGLLLEVLQILGRVPQVEVTSDPQRKPSGSAR